MQLPEIDTDVTKVRPVVEALLVGTDEMDADLALENVVWRVLTTLDILTKTSPHPKFASVLKSCLKQKYRL